MRLLFVSHSFPPVDRPLSNVGGMQRVATELHDALRAHPEVGLSPIVLRSSWRLTHLRAVPFLAQTLWEIRRRAERREIDAVLFSSMVTASLAVALRRTLEPLGIPMAAIVHGRDVTLPFWPYQRFVPRVFDALDAVLPVSRATGAECLERGLSPDKQLVIPNGVDVNRFGAPPQPAAARAALLDALGDPARPLPDRALLLCSVGRQVERKGFAWFVDQVMPLLPSDVHYWLAGDGPEAEQIRAAAGRRGLQERVRLLGRVSEEALRKLYRGADLFVMPNVPVNGDMEGFGVVMLEAGLSGLPVVASRLEGIRDVVAEGENGHLVESGDAWGFSEAILPYHHDRQAIEAAAARALQYTTSHFSWSAVAGRYVEVLQALLPRTPATIRTMTSASEISLAA